VSEDKDWLEMKPEQRDKVSDVIFAAGYQLSTTGRLDIWQETMKRESGKALGRVRRFYRYLASFDDDQVCVFLKGFLS